MTGRQEIGSKSRKLRITGQMDAAQIHRSLGRALELSSVTTLAFDEVNFEPEITAAVIGLIKSSVRVWERIDFEFCDGQLGLIIQTALTLDRVKRLFIASDHSNGPVLKSIATLARINRSMTSLWLLLPLSDEALSCVSDVVQFSPSLEKLSLSGSQLPDSAEAIDLLVQGFRQNTDLRSLDLSCCDLDDDRLSEILLSLQHLSSLTYLDVSRNHSRSKSSNAIGELLRLDHTSLSTLDWREQLTDADDDTMSLDIAPLIAALADNQTLQVLKLSRNSLDDDQIFSLANALTGNSTLSELDLQWNKITDKGVQRCSQLLHDLIGLEVLLLGGNKFSKAGFSFLESLPNEDDSIATINENDLHESWQSAGGYSFVGQAADS